MLIAPLLTPLLAIMPTVLGGPVPDSSATTSTSEDIADLKPNFPLHEKRKFPADYSDRKHPFIGQSCGPGDYWHEGPVDKVMILQYAQPGCQGKTVHNKAKKYRPNSKHSLKHKHKGHHMKTESIQYALPANHHMDFADITFYDGKHKHGHCTGNVVLTIDGSMNQTIDGNRYACHETPNAKCMEISRSWIDREHTATFHKKH